MGITLATYREWSDNPDLGAAQVQDMTQRTARAIYRSSYWNPLRADALPRASISAYSIWASTPGSGARRDCCSGRLAFTGDEVDGCIGPETLGAAAKCDPRTLVNDLADRQADFYRSLADFDTFGAGWLNRTEARRAAALAMTDPAATISA